jgi:hypothetical protein
MSFFASSEGRSPFFILLQIVHFTAQLVATPAVRVVLLLQPSQLRIITRLSQISPGLYKSPTLTCVCVMSVNLLPVSFQATSLS